MGLRRVCVYCGSSPGDDPAYAQAAAALGTALANRQIGLVYGGGKVGLMGVVADAVMAAGGEVVGVITEALLAREVGHAEITELQVVDTMHARKAAMSDSADAFVMLPGGFGTLDEFFEAVTWSQLGIHDKPCGVLNVNGFFDPLLHFVQTQVDKRFIHPEHAKLIVADDDVDRLLDRLAHWHPPQAEKWLDRADR